jgi:hypothetical protein
MITYNLSNTQDAIKYEQYFSSLESGNCIQGSQKGHKAQQWLYEDPQGPSNCDAWKIFKKKKSEIFFSNKNYFKNLLSRWNLFDIPLKKMENSENNHIKGILS